MTMLASQITSLTVVYSIVYSGVNQRKHQSSASLAIVREIRRGPVNFPHKWPVTRKMFPFDDVIMITMDVIASLITSITIVYATVYSDIDQRKHQSSASLAFVWGIHRGPVNSPHMASNAKNVSIWWRHHDLVVPHSFLAIYSVGNWNHQGRDISGDLVRHFENSLWSTKDCPKALMDKESM